MNQGEKLAYLAGIIDGEGSIMLWKSEISPKKRGQFNLRVNVSTTDKCLMNWLYENFGGTIYELNAPSRKNKPHWKQQYIWQVNRPDILKFLKNIYPFLVIKKERCEVAIRFRETFEKRERNLSKETYDLRLNLYLQMKHLNYRGS
jgi:hypothetical protein